MATPWQREQELAEAEKAKEIPAPEINKLTNPNTMFVERLRILCGYIENGTDTVVRVFQDDATREWVVRIGNDAANKWYHGRSLEQAFEAAFQDPKNDPFR